MFELLYAYAEYTSISALLEMKKNLFGAKKIETHFPCFIHFINYKAVVEGHLISVLHPKSLG